MRRRLPSDEIIEQLHALASKCQGMAGAIREVVGNNSHERLWLENMSTCQRAADRIKELETQLALAYPHGEV